jgi:hypothetical protein
LPRRLDLSTHGNFDALPQSLEQRISRAVAPIMKAHDQKFGLPFFANLPRRGSFVDLAYHSGVKQRALATTAGPVQYSQPRGDQI